MQHQKSPGVLSGSSRRSCTAIFRREDRFLQLRQSALEVLGDLVGAAGGTGAAGRALHPGDGVLCLHALEQTADALQVAVAAADDFDGLDGVVIVQHDVGLFGAGALVGVAERLAHIHTSSLYGRLTVVLYTRRAENVNVTRSQCAAPALAGQRFHPGDLVVGGDAGPHRVGLAVVRAVEVAAAGDDEAVGRAEGGALGPVLGAVAGMVHLDAVDGPFGHQLPHKGHTLVHRRVGEHHHRPGGSGCGQHLPHRRVGGGVEASAPRLPAEQLMVQPGVDAVAQAQLLQRLHDAALEEDAAVLRVLQRLLGAELGVERLDLPAALQGALVAALAHDVAVPPQGGAVGVGPEGQNVDAVAPLEVVAGQLGGGDEPHAVLHRVVVGVLCAEDGVVVREGQSAQAQPRCHQGQTVDGHRAVRAGGMGVKIASHSFYSLDLRVIFLRP